MIFFESEKKNTAKEQSFTYKIKIALHLFKTFNYKNR